jgi:O-antigen/teichoic acid export membrane protein
MRRHIAISFIQKHLQMIVSIVSVMVLSRLISPEETGVFSIGVAIAALTHAVRDFGVGNFLIKEHEITGLKINTAFTVSFLIAAVLSLVLLAVSMPVAAFYAKPELASIIWITTGGLLLSPFSTVNMALMLRKHAFSDMFKVSMSSSIANAVVAIGLAWMGYGANSLAFGQLASSAVLVLVSNLLCNEKNMYRFSLSYWKQISNFGMHMTVFSLTEQLGGRASDLIVGKLAGFAAVGLLSRATSLLIMVQDSLQNSMMPVILTNMVADTRKSGDVRPLMLQSMKYLTVVMWPIYAVLALTSQDAVLVLFGQKWVAAAPLTTIFCLGAMFSTVASITGTICNATNRADLLSRYSTYYQTIRIVIVAIGAATYGLLGVVWMLALGDAIQATLAFYYVRKATPLTLSMVFRSCARSMLVAILVGLMVLPVATLLTVAPALRLLLEGLSACAAWVIAVFLVRHPAADEVRLAAGMLMARVRAASRSA